MVGYAVNWLLIDPSTAVFISVQIGGVLFADLPGLPDVEEDDENPAVGETTQSAPHVEPAFNDAAESDDFFESLC